MWSTVCLKNFRETRQLNSFTLYNETTVTLETIDKTSLLHFIFQELISKYLKIMRHVGKALQCPKEIRNVLVSLQSCQNYQLGVTDRKKREEKSLYLLYGWVKRRKES